MAMLRMSSRMGSDVMSTAVLNHRGLGSLAGPSAARNMPTRRTRIARPLEGVMSDAAVESDTLQFQEGRWGDVDPRTPHQT